MSLTSYLKIPEFYEMVLGFVNVPYAEEILDHQNNELSKWAILPSEFVAINFCLQGTAVIYAVREYLLGAERTWETSMLINDFKYPKDKEYPFRWLVMAAMEQWSRKRKRVYLEEEFCVEQIEDLKNIVQPLPNILGEYGRHLGIQNVAQPVFEGSLDVGGADGNLLIENTLWDIRTTCKKRPMTMNDVVHQVGYFLLDYSDAYEMEYISWFYSRQQKLFTHPIVDFLNITLPEAREKFEDYMELEDYGSNMYIPIGSSKGRAYLGGSSDINDLFDIY